MRKSLYEKFSEPLREHAKKIDFEKKKTLPLTKEELKPHQDARNCYICGQKILKNSLKVEIIEKLEIIANIQANIETQHIVFVILNLM